MPLETMTPSGSFDPRLHRRTIQTFAVLDDPGVTIKIWGDDGCRDCQAVLPAFAATLDAAGFDSDRVEHYEVERLPEGRKRGPLVEAYGIDLIPTIVVERDGEELARFVETADRPAADYLADELRSHLLPNRGD